MKGKSRGRKGWKKARPKLVLLFVRNAHLFIILFVRNFWRLCSQFLVVFAILFEVLLIEIEEEIHHFAGLGGGGVKGCKNCEQTFCEQKFCFLTTLIFFSFLFWISLFFFPSRNSLLFWVLFPSFPRILGVRKRWKTLAFLVVFLAFSRKSKEKKIREGAPKLWTKILWTNFSEV